MPLFSTNVLGKYKDKFSYIDIYEVACPNTGYVLHMLVQVSTYLCMCTQKHLCSRCYQILNMKALTF